MTPTEEARAALLQEIARIQVGDPGPEKPSDLTDALIAAVRAECEDKVYGIAGRQEALVSAESAETLAALRGVAEQARLVSQWHGAIGSGPIDELDAELGELGRLARSALAATPAEDEWREASRRLHAAGDDEPYVDDEAPAEDFIRNGAGFADLPRAATPAEDGEYEESKDDWQFRGTR